MNRFVRRCVIHGVELEERERMRKRPKRYLPSDGGLCLEVDLFCPFGHEAVRRHLTARLVTFVLWDVLWDRSAAVVFGDHVTWHPPYDVVFGEPKLAGRSNHGIIEGAHLTFPERLVGEPETYSATHATIQRHRVLA